MFDRARMMRWAADLAARMMGGARAENRFPTNFPLNEVNELEAVLNATRRTLQWAHRFSDQQLFDHGNRLLSAVLMAEGGRREAVDVARVVPGLPTATTAEEQLDPRVLAQGMLLVAELRGMGLEGELARRVDVLGETGMYRKLPAHLKELVQASDGPELRR